MAATYRTRMYDRLDRICFDRYGSTANRQVEIVIDANPGLDLQPILLAENLTIFLPDLAAPPSVPIVKRIKLLN